MVAVEGARGGAAGAVDGGVVDTGEADRLGGVAHVVEDLGGAESVETELELRGVADAVGVATVRTLFVLQTARKHVAGKWASDVCPAMLPLRAALAGDGP